VKLDPECLPPIEATDLLSYLVLETSYYTLKQFKAFKSLEAYNQMVSGFITSVQGKVIENKVKEQVKSRKMEATVAFLSLYLQLALCTV
jgi:hypothetical protein